jgi:putrescine transport system permease protein
VRLGVKPEINAVCSIMIGVVGLAVVAASLFSKFNDSKRVGVTA